VTIDRTQLCQVALKVSIDEFLPKHPRIYPTLLF
jgi:hypothetical protein